MMGILVEGDRLPSESELAAILGISAITLRQSLASLRSKQLLKTTRGRHGGSTIQGFNGVPDQVVIRKLRETSMEGIRDLGDMYAAVSAMSAQLAAVRADQQNINRLDVLSTGFRTAIVPDDLRRTDSKFHVAIAVAAQSSRLAGAMLQVQAEQANLMWDAARGSARARYVAKEHAAILDGIRAHDPAAAAAAAVSHSQAETELLIQRHIELQMDEGE